MKRNTLLLASTLLIPLVSCDDEDADPSADGTTGDPTSETRTNTTTVSATSTTADSSSTSNATTSTTVDATSSSSTLSTTGVSETDSDPGGTFDETETGSGGEIDCTDQLILDLGLVGGTISDASIQNTSDLGGWRSTVDATAGGLPNAANNPWEYLRFSDKGLVRVAVDDLEALESEEWHIAAKRFGIRLNSGSSGPSTVAAAPLSDILYEDVVDLPAGALPLEESFYDELCTLVDDGSGLGSPGYVLTPWWFYPGCVGTSGVPFVIELPDSTRVKLVIDTYYESGQTACNESGAMGSGSAIYGWRWAFLE